MSRTHNLTPKNIREFTPEDTIYIHKPNANGKGMSVLFLCSFVSFEKGRVTGKVLSTDSSYESRKLQIEEGLFESAPLDQCSLYGVSDPDENHAHHHYFDPTGHAFHETPEIRHLRVPKEHPSYGMVSISKVQSSHPRSCFGSPLLHRGTVRLYIHKAELKRSLHEDRFFAKERIMELEMTTAQFAEMLTSPNTQGTPVTIIAREGETQEPCPFVSKIEQFESELRGKIQKITQEANTSMETLNTLVQDSKLSKKEKEHIAGKLRMLRQEVESNLPFLFQQMAEEMGNVIQNAKTEILNYHNESAKAKGLPAKESTESILLLEESKTEQPE